MHAKLLDVNVTSTLHGTQFDVDPMCLEANLVSSQFSKLTVVNGNMDSSDKGNSVMPLHANGPSFAKGMSYADLFKATSVQGKTVPMVPSKMEDMFRFGLIPRLTSHVLMSVSILSLVVLCFLVVKSLGS